MCSCLPKGLLAHLRSGFGAVVAVAAAVVGAGVAVVGAGLGAAAASAAGHKAPLQGSGALEAVDQRCHHCQGSPGGLHIVLRTRCFPEGLPTKAHATTYGQGVWWI